MKSLLSLILLCLAAVFSSGAAESIPSHPNILFLLTDDQRWDTIYALGNPQIKTPTFDRFVNDGFRFNNAICQGSMIGAVCLPSRTMLVTGRSLWRIPPKMRSTEAPAGVPLLPNLVAGSGYATFHCGKTGNACLYGNAAFQTNIGMRPRTAGSATELAEHAIEFLRSYDGQKPFFMYLAPPVPHDPRLAPPEFVKLYDPAKIVLPKQFMPTHPFDPGVLDIRDEQLAPYPRTPEDMRKHLADYFATITHLDFEVGRILDVLKERGWDKNTIIIFSSDQGLAVGGYHGLMGKQNLYEDVKPPLVIVGPGIPHGQSDALVYLYDLFPTICDLAGAKTPDVAEGRSLLPIVQGKETKIRDWMFGAYGTVQRMVRDDRWKLISYHVGAEKNTQLFNLKTDPWEIDNLANNPKFSVQRSRLERQLALSRKEFGDPVDFDGTGAIAAPWNASAAPRKARK